MPVTLDTERAEQARWRLRPRWSWVKDFDELVEEEFLPPDQLLARQSAALRNVVRFAVSQVPYYGEMFRRLAIRADAVQQPDDLTRLPVLTKATVKSREAELQARAVTSGQVVARETVTSGTTGEPVRVLHTAYEAMFALMKQRELRWFRFDPAGVFAVVRYVARHGVTPEPDMDAGPSTLHDASWPAVGTCFETGPSCRCDIASPLEDQVEWLDRLRPDYLMTEAGNLEALALAYQDRDRPDRLQGIEAIANMLTAGMRRRAEKTFGVPIHQNYGLNEIGIVAARCPEGGRYHVNSRLCIVEIVDEDGAPCLPGQKGRVLVTGLTNYAMPLLRYDTDDVVEVVEGPCPCGRTLPSFGAVDGRYRRTACLPAGTYGYWLGLVSALDHMPDALLTHLRQYQLHQFLDGRFELRLVTAGTPPAGFTDYIEEGWRAATMPHRIPLAIARVARILPGAGHKVHNFTSDFAPPSDTD